MEQAMVKKFAIGHFITRHLWITNLTNGRITRILASNIKKHS